MKIDYSKKFKKQYLQLAPKLQQKFDDKIRLFIINPYDPVLRNHVLSGKYIGYSSINMTGDLRALYFQKGESIIIFGFIGTHSQLYG